MNPSPTTDSAQPSPALLLSTKLYRPPLRSAIVPRPRLTRLLNDSLQHALTVVCAPAGFGKTTLLSEWRAADQTVPLAWVSLDEADSDPGRFWTYVLAALDRLHAGIGDTARAMMRSPQPPPIDLCLTALINDLATLPADFVLVLDDYHTITSQAVHEALAFLLDHLPAPMHVIILSRADPPLPLSRLRARRQLLELRAADLRCTSDEAATFLNHVMNLNLTDANVSALEARTEGWLAGLQLAALSMQGRDDVAGFIASFTGDDRYVLDYLAEEVLQRQPAAIQAFLLDTAVLARMTAPLCNAVAGRDDAQRVLEYLERSNLFIVPLDNTRRWYRYHHLFADLLRHRLQHLYPDRVADLHRRAAQWFEQQPLLDEAITHSLAAQDFDRAARLIEQAIRPTYFARNEPVTLLNWINALPVAQVQAHPAIGVGQAWCLMTFGQLDQATRCCEEVAATLGDTPTDRVRLGELDTVLGTISMLRGDVPQLARYAEHALQNLPPDDVLMRGIVLWQRGQVHRFAGQPAAAAQLFGEAAQASHAAGNIFFELLSWSNRADRLCEQGRLRDALEAHRQVQTLAAQGRRPPPIIGDSYGWTAVIEWERNDLDAALADAVRGSELTAMSGIPEITLTTFIAHARVLRALGQIDQAQAVMADTLDRARQYGVPHMLELVEAAMAQARLHHGDLTEAWRWADTHPIDPLGPIEYRRDEVYLIYAEICFAQGRAHTDRELLQRTAVWLQRIVADATENRRHRQALRAQIILAAAQAALAQKADALNSLDRALILGQPEGFVRSFTIPGEAMRSLLMDYRLKTANATLKAHADQLLAVFRPPADAAVQTQPRASQNLIEPLSDRELDVLRLIANDRSNQDIAGALYVSVNTVKTHIQHIYEKLNVSSRLSAVEEARRLKII